MLTVHSSRAIYKSQTYFDISTLHEATPCKLTNVNPLTNTVVSPVVARTACSIGLHSSSISWKGCAQIKLHYPPHHITSKIWLCRLHDSASSDDEYRSSRNIAISLFKRYRNFIDRGGGDNLKEFIGAGVNAYALGCTDEGLRKELADMKESGIHIEAMQTYGGSTSLKSKICYEEVAIMLSSSKLHSFAITHKGVDECIMWLSIIFITILCTPQPTIVRWSSTPPVSDEMKLQWKGFCAIIANAYYVRGMAWLPVKTLQLEQMAVVGRAEEPSVVASRMRLVFSTLEVVSPQWPKV